MSLRERIGFEHPVVGAGLGGGLARARLTVAIGEAGGLGQLGIMPPAMLRAELDAHRARSDPPGAVNMLLPFTRRDHWGGARSAGGGGSFWGGPRGRAGGGWGRPGGSGAA